mgnify:CR=1 FL=1
MGQRPMEQRLPVRPRLQGHRMFRGNEITRWHSDEIYLQRPPNVPDDVAYPPVINVLNCHYYLVDVPEELGPTQVVPGSHRACRQPRPEDGDPPRWRGQGPVSLTVRAGDCIVYSNQMWHRGAISRPSLPLICGKFTRDAHLPNTAIRLNFSDAHSSRRV